MSVPIFANGRAYPTEPEVATRRGVASDNQHRIAIAEEAVALGNGSGVSGPC